MAQCVDAVASTYASSVASTKDPNQGLSTTEPKAKAQMVIRMDYLCDVNPARGVCHNVDDAAG